MTAAAKKAVGAPLSSDRQGLPFKHIPVRVMDPDSKIFHLQSEAEENRLGVCFLSFPLIGADDGTIERLKAVLTTPVPAGTMIQFGLFTVPDIHAQVGMYKSGKVNAKGVLRALVDNRVKMFEDGVSTPIRGMNNVLLSRQQVVFSITVPCDEEPTSFQLESMKDIAEKMKEGMVSVGLHLSQLDREGYLALLRRFFRLLSNDDYHVDDYAPLREQVFGPSDNVDFEKKDIISFQEGEDDQYFSKIVSVKHFPRKASIGLMNMLIGDPLGSPNQIADPYWMVTTIYYPDQDAKATAIRGKHAFVTQQSFGGMTHMIPLLGYKKHGLDLLVHEMDGNNGMLCELNYTAVFFSRTKERLNSVTSQFRAWAATYGMELAEDRTILMELFYNLLPMCTTQEWVRNLHRFHTMGITHAIRLLPIIGNWPGSGTGGTSILMGRRGQPIMFDPYDSSTNYNGIIIAESGAGKSVLAQQMLEDALAEGARAWVIDQGRSYQKFCGTVNGQFIEFSDNSDICLNPFTRCQDLDEDMDMLKAVFAKMAAPEAGLGDFGMAALEEKIKAAFTVSAKNTDVTDVADQCLNDKDQRIIDIGKQLYSFTNKGSFGRWFNGKNNVDLSNDLVVLELQELQSKKTLQQVVLMLLFSSINDEMYLTHGRRKYLMIDESWALLDDPIMAKYIEAGYRKVRKHEGSAWIITQNIADVYASDNGRAIVGSAAWQIIMQQRSDSIEHAVKSGNLRLDPYAAMLLKSVHTAPGVYSEMMIRRSEEDWGIARLIIDRFSQILFSTKGWERDLVLDRMSKGENVVEIINQLVKEGR